MPLCFNDYTKFRISHFPRECRLHFQAVLGLYPPSTIYIFRHTSHAEWIYFLNNSQTCDKPRGLYLQPKGPWIAVGALGLFLIMRDLTIGRIAWVVFSQFPTSVSHLWTDFLLFIFLMTFLTQLTAVLHAGSRVSCRSFRNLCFNKWCTPQRPWLFMSESETLLVDSLNAESIVAAK
jgi:hypothetical protein